MRTPISFLGLLCACVLAACASAPAEDFDLAGVGVKPDGGRCAPGETQPCVCLGGGAGTQTCRASGQSYGTCVGCAGEDSDGGPTLQDGGGNPCGDCDGCCNGATCVPFANQNNAQCGQRGQSCDSCGTKICDGSSGLCVDASGTCNASMCANGCCKMVSGTPTCFINQPAACGTAGGTCTPCPYGVLCNGACTTQIDGNAQFKVVVQKATFYNTDVDHTSCWDNYAGFGCAQPDVFICLGYNQGGTQVEACTTQKNDVPVTGKVNNEDVDEVTWNDSDGLIKQNGSPFLIPGSLFIAGGQVRVRVYENDSANSDETIGSAVLGAFTQKNASQTFNAFGRVTSLTISLR